MRASVAVTVRIAAGLDAALAAVSFAVMLTFLADHLDFVIIGAAILFFLFQTELTGRNSH